MKATPRPLIAMLGSGEDDAAIAGQHGFEQGGGNGGGLVDEQQIARDRLLQQLQRGKERQLVRLGARMFEQEGHRGPGRRRDGDAQPGLVSQQGGRSQPERSALAATAVGTQHQGTTTMTMQHLLDGRDSPPLIRRHRALGP